MDPVAELLGKEPRQKDKEHKVSDTLTESEKDLIVNGHATAYSTLLRKSGMMCRGDGTAVWVQTATAVGMKPGKIWSGPDGKPTKTSPLYRMQTEAKVVLLCVVCL